MNISQKSYLLALFICISGLAFSQENKYEKRSFPMSADYLSEIYNITCKMPAHFTDLKELAILKIKNGNFLHCPVIQSDNQECMTLCLAMAFCLVK